MTEISIAGARCRALRHGMAAAIGLEIWGPWDQRDLVRDTIINEGREFGLRLAGGMSYLIGALESGWYQMVLPAIYTGASLAGFPRMAARRQPGRHPAGAGRQPAPRPR